LLRDDYSPTMIHESPIATGLLSRRAARIADEQRRADLCHRRASKWAEAIREGLDSDIARFMRDQAAAWQLLAASYASSAGHSPNSE
jgi:hypothetical protein